MLNDFMNESILTTFAGITVVVMLIVQFTKSIIKKRLGDSFVRIYSFFISFIIIFTFRKTGNSLNDIILMVINSIMITMSAAGVYEIITDPFANKFRR